MEPLPADDTTSARVAQRFRALWVLQVLDGVPTLDRVDDALHWARGEVQRELPGECATMSDEQVDALVSDDLDFATSLSAENIKIQHPAVLEHDRAVASAHRDDARDRAGRAIDLLRVMRWVSAEEVVAFDARYGTQTARYEVLLRLHARAITVTDEVTCLLDAGLVSGAQARWRTLHEFAVVATLVATRDEQTAQRYRDHAAVVRHKRAVEYNRNASALGEEALAPAEIADQQRERDRLIASYGRDFASEYGWAAHLFGHRPSFRELEQAGADAHLRPHYQFASGLVHSDAHSLLLAVDEDDPRAVIVGPHVRNMIDPIQLTARSLRATSAALMLCVEEDALRGLLALAAVDAVYDRLGAALEAVVDLPAARPALSGLEPELTGRPLSAWPNLPRRTIWALSVAAGGRPASRIGVLLARALLPPGESRTGPRYWRLRRRRT